MCRPFSLRELFLVFAAWLIVGTTADAAPVTLTVEKVEAAPGSETRVPVSVKNAQEVGAIQFHLLYDPKVLEWKGGELHSGISSAAADFKLVDPGRVRVALVLGEQGMNGDQPLLDARFTVTGAAGTSSSVTISVPRAWTHQEIVEMQVETQPGGVDVVEARPGISNPWILIGSLVAGVVLLMLLVLLRRRRGKARA